MKTIKVANYSVYSDGGYSLDEMNFEKLYKGVRVLVDYNGSSRFMYFAIRTAKPHICIWKRSTQEMRALIFDDASMSVTCDYARTPKDEEYKLPQTLTFKEEVYKELKQLIPVFMKECGAQFECHDEGSKLALVFGN